MTNETHTKDDVAWQICPDIKQVKYADRTNMLGIAITFEHILAIADRIREIQKKEEENATKI